MSYGSGNRDKPNSGVLFTNDRKQTDKHPDMTGYLLFDVDVIEALIKSHRTNQPMKLRLSGWLGRSNRGTDYVSMRFGVRDTPVGEEQARNTQQAAQAPQAPQPRTLQQPPLSQPRTFGQPQPQPVRQTGSIIDDEIPF